MAVVSSENQTIYTFQRLWFGQENGEAMAARGAHCDMPVPLKPLVTQGTQRPSEPPLSYHYI